MAKLSDDVKTFIVQQLAMYESPSDVAAAVKETFDVAVTRQGVHFYDPTVGAEHAGEKWVVLFHHTRAAFIDDMSSIGIAQRSTRLRWLDQSARRLLSKGNVLGAAQLLEQAAKEVGGMFTNRRELTGKDGDPLIPEMTDDERRGRVIEIMREAAKRRDLAQSVAPKKKKKKAAAG